VIVRANPKALAGNSGERRAAFTLIELLIVMSIIIVLAGLILGIAGYAQKKGARSRAEAEIAAMSAALESYKSDNGIYPDTVGLDARTDLYPGGTDKGKYETASLALYVALTGDTNANRTIDSDETGKSYFNFKPNMLSPSAQTANVTAIRDPFSNSYGYSTVNQSTPTKGYNPTFDLWSTSGDKDPSTPVSAYIANWVKNW
jgi:type II secretory pathway pseudopilin PulG